MRTKVTKDGRASVPSKIRKQLHIAPGTALEWVIEGTTARIIPIPADPIKAFRGSGKKEILKKLLRERQRDRRAEDFSKSVRQC